MTFLIVIDPRAQREIDEFAAYAGAYSQAYAEDHVPRMARFLSIELAERPLRWGYFPLTGAPFHGHLFQAGRKAKYWIVYKVDERARVVRILRFWHSSRHPRTLRSLA